MNNGQIEIKHDLWILIKKKFIRSHSSEVEKIFIDSLNKINTK